MPTEICSRSDPSTTNYTTNQNQSHGRQKEHQRKPETEAALLQGQHFIFSHTELNCDVENKLLNKGNLVCVKGSKDDELVKYMSNLPGYLRRQAPGSKNEQEKALSVGVLDWRRLERWKKNQMNTSISAPGNSFSNSLQSSSSFRDKSDTEGDYSSRDGGIDLAFPPVGRHQKIVLLLPGDLPRSSFSNSSQSLQADDRICGVRRSFSDVIHPTYTDATSEILRSCPPRVKREQPHSLPRSFPDRCSPKGARVSSGIGSVGRSMSVAERSTRGGSHGPSKPAVDDSGEAHALGRSRSSPLRRLLDPILKPWSDKPEKRKSCQGHEPVPALLQLRFRNGSPLFKFSTEGDSGEALVATLKRSGDSLNESGRRVYTFYSVRESKKGRGWGRSGKKEKGRYVYGVAGWMDVVGSKDGSSVRSVLFADEGGRPRELAAIVSEVPNSTSGWGYRRDDGVEGRSRPNKTTTVILPNGVHGVPSVGLPSCLVDRWRSGGSCDCGGWDVGCRIRVLTNRDALSASSSSSSSSRNQFRIFFQGRGERAGLMMIGRKEGIYCVKIDATLSLLQAFSICVSLLNECSPFPLKPEEQQQEEDHEEEEHEVEEEEGGRRYTTPFPPPSPAGRV